MPPISQEQILRQAMELLAQADWSLSPMLLSARLRELIRQESGVEDPYLELKERSNRLALGLVEQLRDQLRQAEHPLELALAASIAGNVLDYGTPERFDLNETLAKISMADAFAIDQRRALIRALEGASSIAVLADNAGEIVFDRILLETIRERLGAKRVVFVVRRAPFINDALLEDAHAVGLDELEGLSLMTMAPQIPASEGDLGWRTWREVLGCEVILSKGQGNYEAFSEVPGVFFLLMAKCRFVARDLALRLDRDLPVGAMILYRAEAPRAR